MADFLTKPLGRQPFKYLTDEAMGATQKDSVFRFCRNDWAGNYERSLNKIEDDSEILQDKNGLEIQPETRREASPHAAASSRRTDLSREGADTATQKIRGIQVSRKGGVPQDQGDAEFDPGSKQKTKSTEWPQAEASVNLLKAPKDVQGGMKKVSLVYCNTMMIPSATSQEEEFVCEDIDDFVKYEHHCLRVVEDTLLRDLKVEAKHYGRSIVLQSITSKVEREM